jgi:YesN/AraC family two-component response regulator
MDITMPVMEGIQAVKEIHKLDSEGEYRHVSKAKSKAPD